MRKISFSLAHKYKQFFHCSLLIIHYSLNIYAFCDPDRKLEVFEIHLGRIANHIRNFH